MRFILKSEAGYTALPVGYYTIYRAVTDIAPGNGAVFLEGPLNNPDDKVIVGTGTTQVSRRASGREGHLRINVLEQMAVLTDLGSTAGSYLDGAKFTETQVDSLGERK